MHIIIMRLYRNVSCALFHLVFFFSLASRYVGNNRPDQPLKAYCGKEQAIYGVSSAYSTGHSSDRIWKFFCKKIEQPKCFNCETSSEYDTQYQQHIAFNCPPNQVISGLESVHNNGREDRIWKFRCCANFEHVTTNCELTGYINNLKKGLDYKAGQDKVIVGLHSYWRHQYLHTHTHTNILMGA